MKNASTLRRRQHDALQFQRFTTDCDHPISHWNADDNIQLAVDSRCVRIDSHPHDERYLFTVVQSHPWAEGNLDDESNSSE